ncbi:hypothetical protein O181_094563 [Austropuccinia psidii MF-1]|uniref:Uncharacterized protein n=1 Tax=Austropuccinia psidii MF-1 TaxID=1389203 RepID=A0A9Q3J3D9_9BASI|nr:hypothetical protein [Austropuccinia psidii MF-1]
MDITLELAIRYHERQKENNHNPDKNTEASKSSSFHNQNSSSSSHKRKNFRGQKRDKLHYSLFNRDQKLMGSGKEEGKKGGLCAYCDGKHSLEACFKRPHNQLTQPADRFPSKGKA